MCLVMTRPPRATPTTCDAPAQVSRSTASPGPDSALPSVSWMHNPGSPSRLLTRELRNVQAEPCAGTCAGAGRATRRPRTHSPRSSALAERLGVEEPGHPL